MGWKNLFWEEEVRFVCFGHIEFEMAFRYPGCDARLAVGEGWIQVAYR